MTSYVLLIAGTAQVPNMPAPSADYLSERIQAQYTSGPYVIPASQRALVVDAVISFSNNFASVPGALPVNISNHMTDILPSEGHVAFVDGKVRWRAFQRGGARLVVNPNYFTVKTSGVPTFWF